MRPMLAADAVPIIVNVAAMIIEVVMNFFMGSVSFFVCNVVIVKLRLALSANQGIKLPARVGAECDIGSC